MKHLLSANRCYTNHELRTDAIVHILGIAFSVSASLWLLAHVTGLSIVVSVSVYCAGLLSMILASAAYNLMRRGSTKEILRRIDRAAIFVMIAATYTPFAANRLRPETGGALLFVIWACATVGAGCTLMFSRRFERFSLLFYLTMGWMVIVVIKPLSASVAPFDLALLFTGGIVYSTGVIFHLQDRIPHHKAIWHSFVLAASALQFAAIAAEFAT